MLDYTLIDGQTTLAKRPRRRPPKWMLGGIVACLVIIAGVGTAIALTVYRSPNEIVDHGLLGASRPSGSTSAAAGTGQGGGSAFEPATPVTRGSACVEGDVTGDCYDDEGYGPPLPASLQGQPYSCLRMADTSRCVDIFVHDPTDGSCTEFYYIAPRAPGTEQGWKRVDWAAEVRCVG